MAQSLNARFSADFSELEKAVKSVNANLDDFGLKTQATAREVAKIGTSFNGADIKREAAIAIGAINEIGGVTRLTNAEQVKLGTTVNDAIAKYRLLGQEVPPSLSKVSTELSAINSVGKVEQAVGGLKNLGSAAGPAGIAVEGVASKFTQLGSTASLLGPVGIAIAGIAAATVGLGVAAIAAVDGLVGLVEHAADAGDQMLTLSNKTKIGVDALSAFKYVGEQTGTSLDSITGAVFKMSVGLGKGSADSQKAIHDLGLKFEDLKNARPEDAFVQIVQALSGVGNTAKQQAEGVAIFQKSYKDVANLTKEDIPGMLQRFKDLGGGVTEEMAHAGDAVHDAMNDIAVAFEAVRLKIGGAFLPTVAAVLQKFADAWILATKDAGVAYVGFAQTLDQVAAEVVQIIGATILAVSDLAKSARGAGEDLVSFGKAIQVGTLGVAYEAGKTFVEAGKQLEGFGDASKNVTPILDKLGFALGTTTAGALTKIREQIIAAAEEARKSQQSWSGLGDSLDPPKDKIKSLGDEMAKTIAQAKKTAAEFDSGKLSIANLGAKQAEVNKLFLDAAQDMQAMGNASGPLYDKFTKIAFATANWQTTLGPLKLGLEDVLKTLPKLADTLTSTDIAIGSYAHNLNTLPDIGKAFGLKTVPKDLKDADDAFQSSLKKTSDAYHAFGLTSRAELQQAAIAAVSNYQILLKSGTATVDQLRIAYQQMIDAQIAATGRLPTLWQTLSRELPQIVANLFSSINQNISQGFITLFAGSDAAAQRSQQRLQDVRDSLKETFGDIVTVHKNAQVILESGTQELKDSFAGIGDSIKDTFTGVLDQILSYFEKVFIAKITASLLGNGSVWSALIGTALSSGVQSGVANAAIGGVAQSGAGAITQYGTSIAGGAAGLYASGSAPAAGGLGVGSSGITAGGSTLGWGSAVGYIGGPVAGGIVGFEVGKATGSKLAGAGAGAATGAAVGWAAGPIGAGVGAGVGALAGLYGAHRANEDARDSMVAIRAQLQETFGSLDKVRQAASLVGVNIDKAFQDIGRGVDGVDEFNSVVGQFQDKFTALDGAMKRYGITIDELTTSQKSSQDQVGDQVKQLESDFKALTSDSSKLPKDTVITKMADSFNALLIAAKDSGTQIPAELEPILDRMVELGLVSDDAKNKLLGIGTAGSSDMQKATEIAQKYGITLAQLGPSFQQADISARAKDIFADFSTLKDLNVDIGGSLAGMSDEISQFVVDAKKAGAEVPDNMRPILEELLANGQLIDENGDKLTDLSGIKFGQPMADQFAPVTDAIHDLIAVLTGKDPKGLPGALQAGIDQMAVIASKAQIRIPVGFDIPNLPDDFPDGYPNTRSTPPGERPMATGGIVTQPTHILAGEAGPEAIIPLNRAGINGGGGQINIHVHTNLDGREVAYTIVPYVPDVLALHGLARY